MQHRTIAFPAYSEYSNATLLAAFTAGAARLRASLAGLSDAQCHTRVRGPTRWSIHEIVLHIADSETQGTFRIRKVWSDPPATWPIFDQDVWAKELDYAASGAPARERALTLLELLRERTAPLFARATDADWAKWGTHPEFGRMTLRNLLELYADHVERHIEQVLESRRLLGHPLEMDAPLPRRLY
ncbi:MAG: DinB family protein [Gemmatimonadetes bacterium]|nr:DinB family protein [Gemmatimonadota bacterium]